MEETTKISEIYQLERYLKGKKLKKIFLVCGHSFDKLPIKSNLEALGIPMVRFSDFSPNPDFTAVQKGIALFLEKQCDSIMAVGGGSAIDVAKCIKHFSQKKLTQNGDQLTSINKKIVFMAIPTTAGSGSEATHFAVVYENGIKKSIADNSLLPECIVFMPELLQGLPVYQRKATMLDALCHAVESWWSVNSTEESRRLSKASIAGIWKYKSGYLNCKESANAPMQQSAYLAGKAINLAKTTAAHAMAYTLTSEYHIAHGHAAFLMLPNVWEFMVCHPEQCIDPRGWEYVKKIFYDIAHAISQETPQDAIRRFRELINDLELTRNFHAEKNAAAEFAEKVNLQRLKNNPIKLDQKAVETIYKNVLC